MKLYEQLKLIHTYTPVVIKCRYKNEREFFNGRVNEEYFYRTLHDGNLCDMDFVEFHDAMYYEVENIYPKYGKIYIVCRHGYKD